MCCILIFRPQAFFKMNTFCVCTVVKQKIKCITIAACRFDFSKTNISRDSILKYLQCFGIAAARQGPIQFIYNLTILRHFLYISIIILHTFHHQHHSHIPHYVSGDVPKSMNHAIEQPDHLDDPHFTQT